MRWAIIALLVLGAAPVFLAARALTFEAPDLAHQGPDWRGALHVHSDRSHDGRGSPEQIVREAARAGLQFVVLTDHDREPEPARTLGGVLLVPGVELGTPHGHLLSLGHRQPFEPAAREGRIAQIRARGGVSVLAHPVQRRNPWRDWPGAAEVDGLELYSGDSMFRGALARPLSRLVPAVFAAPVAAGHALAMFAADPAEARARLLELSASRPRLGLCAHDAHGLPSYEASFRSLSLRVPAPPPGALDDASRSAWILARISEGRVSCVFDPLGEPGQVELQGVPLERTAQVGDLVAVRWSAPLEGKVRAHGAATTALPDGRVRLDAPGAVLLEVWREGPAPWIGSELRPWLVTQPIRVTAREN